LGKTRKYTKEWMTRDVGWLTWSRKELEQTWKRWGDKP